MNPKHFHTPISTRLRCPVCHQAVYSRAGIHPQCAMRQSEPVMPRTDKSKIPALADPGNIGAVIADEGALDDLVAVVAVTVDADRPATSRHTRL
jgi:hypothetical protein